MEQNEQILSGMKQFLNSQIEPHASCLSENTKNVYESYMSNENEGNYESLTHQNIFNKICMDFLKNNSTSDVTQDERSEPEGEAFDPYWQESSEVPHMMSLSCEHLGAIDDLSPPFGSFLALLSSYQWRVWKQDMLSMFPQLESVRWTWERKEEQIIWVAQRMLTWLKSAFIYDIPGE